MDNSTLDCTAFALGYLDGRKSRKEITRRQAERKLRGLPSTSVECYINGHCDGVRGNDYRYRLSANAARTLRHKAYLNESRAAE